MRSTFVKVESVVILEGFEGDYGALRRAVYDQMDRGPVWLSPKIHFLSRHKSTSAETSWPFQIHKVKR